MAGGDRGQVLQAIADAGLEPWPELFNSLRSTRETELCQMGVPLSEVAEVIGHSVRVAEKNYLQQMGRARRQEMLARAHNTRTAQSGNEAQAAATRNEPQTENATRLASKRDESQDDASCTLAP